MDMISIIVPCYNEEETVELFFEAMQQLQRDFPNPVQWEYIFVNDGSSDKTLEKLRSLSHKYIEVHYLSFSRNFGKEAALYAGLKAGNGDYVAVMDADLQDPPQMLCEMYSEIKSGNYDGVGARRTDRSDEPFLRSIFARLFYYLINKVSDIEIVDGARDFRLMSRQMVDAILEVSEYNRFSKGIFSWVGFNMKYLPYKNQKRVAGTTSWSFWGLFKYSLEGFLNYSQFLLDIISIIGILFFVISIIMAAYFAIRTLFFGNETSGWTSLIVVVLGLGGIQLLSLGIVAKYIGKTYLETKNRPIYIIKETDDNLEKK